MIRHPTAFLLFFLIGHLFLLPNSSIRAQARFHFPHTDYRELLGDIAQRLPSWVKNNLIALAIKDLDPSTIPYYHVFFPQEKPRPLEEIRQSLFNRVHQWKRSGTPVSEEQAEQLWSDMAEYQSRNKHYYKIIESIYGQLYEVDLPDSFQIEVCRFLGQATFLTDPEKAIQYFNKGFRIYDQMANEDRKGEPAWAVAASLLLYVDALRELGEEEKAIELSQRLHADPNLNEQIHPLSKLDLLEKVADLEFKRKKYDGSRKLLKSALKLLKDIRDVKESLQNRARLEFKFVLANNRAEKESQDDLIRDLERLKKSFSNNLDMQDVHVIYEELLRQYNNANRKPKFLKTLEELCDYYLKKLDRDLGNWDRESFESELLKRSLELISRVYEEGQVDLAYDMADRVCKKIKIPEWWLQRIPRSVREHIENGKSLNQKM